jgi:hypothetical protein
MEYGFGNEMALLVGASFLCGGATGFGVGALVGLSRNLGKLPLVGLNQTLTTASCHAERWAYESAIVTSLAIATKSLANKAKLGPVATYASAGAAVGAFGGAHWSFRAALRGGLFGATVGAGVGLFARRPAFDRLGDNIMAFL